MELEFEKRGLTYLLPLLQEIQTQEQTQEIRLTDGMPDLGRILGTWGQVILRSKEWQGDRVSITGGVMAFVLYAPEDGGSPRTLESWIPFQMKWNLEDGQREGELRVQSLLRFLDARLVSARKVMLRCGISARAQAFRQETAMVSIPGALPEDIQVLKSRYPLRLPKWAGEKPFLLEETVELSQTAPDRKNLVSYSLEPRVSECRILSGKLVLRGNAGLHLVCLSGENRLESHNLELPYSQLVELEGEWNPDAQGNARVAVTGLEVESDPEGKIHVKANLLAQFLVNDREVVEVAEDVYSTGRNVEPKWEELNLCPILDQQEIQVPVRQIIRQNAGEIADVRYLPDFPVLHRGENVRVEMPGQFQVLWYDENENLQSATARTEEARELPAGEETRFLVSVTPGEMPTAGTGSGIELKGESLLEMTATSRRGLSVVTGLTIGEEMLRDHHRPSLILRRAGDAGLWQIAKNCGSTVAAIQKANGLEEEPTPERILLIPVS